MKLRVHFIALAAIAINESTHAQVHVGFYNDTPPANTYGPIELTTDLVFDQNFDVLRHASSTYCPWILLDPYMTFFARKYAVQPNGSWEVRPPSLRSDYDHCLRALKELVPSEAAIDGFILGDEPLWFGATTSRPHYGGIITPRLAP